nr:MAG TPA: hypothetical protein [Caudoviricetes sp.]
MLKDERINLSSYHLPKGGSLHPSQREEDVSTYQTQKRNYTFLCSAYPLSFPFVSISVCETYKEVLTNVNSLAYLAK